MKCPRCESPVTVERRPNGFVTCPNCVFQTTYPVGSEKFNDPKYVLKDTEASIQADGILEVNRAFPDNITLWRNNTGAVKIDGQFIRFGLPGQADASGIIKPGGVRLEIEFKKPKGRQSEAQKHFQAMIENHGGVYLLCNGDIQNQLIRPLAKIIERQVMRCKNF